MRQSLLSKLFIAHLGIDDSGEELSLRQAWRERGGSQFAHLQLLAEILIDYEERGRPVSDQRIDPDDPRWPNTRPDIVSVINGQLLLDNETAGQTVDKPYVSFVLTTHMSFVLRLIDSTLAQMIDEDADRRNDFIRYALSYDGLAEAQPSCRYWLNACLDAYQVAWVQAESDFQDTNLTSRSTAWRMVRDKRSVRAKKPTRYMIVHTRSTSPRFFTYACWWANQQDSPPNVIALVEQKDGWIVLSTGMSLEHLSWNLPNLIINDPRRGFIPHSETVAAESLIRQVHRAIENEPPTSNDWSATVPSTVTPPPQTINPSEPQPAPQVVHKPEPTRDGNTAPGERQNPTPRSTKACGLTFSPFIDLLKKIQPQ
jgi:hypothetical protein